MIVVRECQAGAPAAPIAEIAADPQGIHWMGKRGLEHGKEDVRSPFGRVLVIVNGTAISIRVERVIGFDLLQRFYDRGGRHDGW